ncbi:hypothetical protein BH09VER1_BH09VER1_27630 [soil metagenome]
MTVLALMTILLAQMLGITSQTWLSGQSRVNNYTKARAILDLFARDIQGGVYRDDLAAFPGTNIAFYTQRAGLVSSTNKVRNISLVSYNMGPRASGTTLERADFGTTLNGSASDISFGLTNLPIAQAQPRDTASGVIAFKVLFAGTNGVFSTTYDPTNRPHAISVALATVDDATLKKLSASQIATLRAKLDSVVSGTNSVKGDWDTCLANGFDWNSYPRSLASGLKVFERYVYLP